jgi:hypothetical protein
MKTFLTQICLTKKGVYSSYTPMRRTHKLAARLGVAAAVTAAATLLPASPASAGSCLLGGRICGVVRNNTSWGMHVTLNLEAKVPGRCDVWNIHGGPVVARRLVGCTQEYLAPGHRRGGSGEDVDGFTFNDRGYWVIMFGTWTWHQKGVWTKIRTGQQANCSKSWGIDSPTCFV